MLDDTQGGDAAPVVEEATPTESQPAEVTTQVESETQEVSNDAVVEVEAEVEEINYQERSEKLEKETAGKQGKIDKQRAALTQSNDKIQELQSQLAGLQVQQAPVQPNIEEFETHEDYVEALSEFKAEARFQTKKQEDLLNQQQQALNQRNEQQQSAFLKDEQVYRQANPNYDRAKTEVQDFMRLNPVGGPTGDAIYEQASNEGGLAEIINYFGDDGGERLPELDRIANLSPVQAAVEIYKIQQSIKAVTPVKEKSLPKPLKTIKGTSKGGPKELSTDMSGKEILARLGIS